MFPRGRRAPEGRGWRGRHRGHFPVNRRKRGRREGAGEGHGRRGLEKFSNQQSTSNSLKYAWYNNNNNRRLYYLSDRGLLEPLFTGTKSLTCLWLIFFVFSCPLSNNILSHLWFIHLEMGKPLFIVFDMVSKVDLKMPQLFLISS